MTRNSVDLTPALAIYADVMQARIDRDYERIRKILSSRSTTFFREHPAMAALYATAVFRTQSANIAEKVAQQLIRELRHTGMSPSVSELKNVYGVALFEQGKLIAAHHALTDAHKAAMASGNRTVAAWTEMNLGVISDIKCKWTNALAHYERAKVTFLSTGDTRGLALVYNNQSITYRQIGFLSTAYDAAEKARAYSVGTVSEDDIVMFNCSRSELLAELDQYDFARRVATLALAKAKELKLHRQRAECLRVIGKIELLSKNFAIAESFLEKARSTAAQANANLMLAEISQLLSLVFKATSRPEMAKDASAEAQNLFKTCGAARRGRTVGLSGLSGN